MPEEERSGSVFLLFSKLAQNIMARDQMSGASGSLLITQTLLLLRVMSINDNLIHLACLII